MTTIIPFSTRQMSIDGMVHITMKQFTDERGTIREFYRESAFVDAGLASLGPFVQVNVTENRRGTIRGMHGEDLTKLVAVAAGSAFGAWVDARPDSPTHGVVDTLLLAPGAQVLVPAGVCNGFQALEEGTQFLYAFDVEWTPGMAGVASAPLDPALAIPWPIAVDPDDPSLLSAKDRDAPRFGGAT